MEVVPVPSQSTYSKVERAGTDPGRPQPGAGGAGVRVRLFVRAAAVHLLLLLHVQHGHPAAVLHLLHELPHLLLRREVLVHRPLPDSAPLFQQRRQARISAAAIRLHPAPGHVHMGAVQQRTVHQRRHRRRLRQQHCGHRRQFPTKQGHGGGDIPAVCAADGHSRCAHGHTHLQGIGQHRQGAAGENLRYSLHQTGRRRRREEEGCLCHGGGHLHPCRAAQLDQRAGHVQHPAEPHLQGVLRHHLEVRDEPQGRPQCAHIKGQGPGGRRRERC
mmetsp:Transcript_5458/g.10990  ORF Transcript_5458/g.10990 Transcript_5458/m.10990 type:complete len:273 (+) Transcript_5458:1753-2571(+)